MSKKTMTRRRFVQSTLVGSTIMLGATWSLSRHSASAQSNVIRPPGALDEAAFLSACVRCGLCVQSCPYDTLRLFDHDASASVGTPYFIAREIPCEMCSDIPCVQACPTGALSPTLQSIRDAEMGVATLSHPYLCNSYIGAAYCDSCYQACPLIDEAIFMQVGATKAGGLFTPVVDPEVCTGCGKCEQACIAREAAIRVVPSHV